MEIRDLGLDSTRALGVIISHPEKLRDVCTLINGTMAVTQLSQLNKPSRELQRSPGLNRELHALADSVGISHADAVQLMKDPTAVKRPDFWDKLKKDNLVPCDPQPTGSKRVVTLCAGSSGPT